MDKYMTPIAVLVGALIIAGAFAFGRGDAGIAGQQGNEPTVPVNIEEVKTDTGPFIGDKNAPVTMAVWYDYQCGHCKNYDATTLKELKASHVDTGKVRLLLKDFQFFPGSEEVAVFGRAMWEAYPDQHYAWFAGVMELPANGQLTVAQVKEVAAGLPGVDANRVAQLATDKHDEYLAAVKADREEGTSFGITGTPATIIGTQMLGGEQPYTVVSAAVDGEM